MAEESSKVNAEQEDAGTEMSNELNKVAKDVDTEGVAHSAEFYLDEANKNDVEVKFIAESGQVKETVAAKTDTGIVLFANRLIEMRYIINIIIYLFG